MPVISGKLKRAWLGALLACFAAAGQNSRPGPVIGVIDDVRFEEDQYYVFGWACQQGNRGSIDVHLYANHAAGDTPPGKFVMAGKADLGNEPAVDQECHDANGGKHRFRIALPNQLLKTFQNKKLYAHGIAIAGNVENAAIAGSGEKHFPKPRWPIDPPLPDVFDGARVAVFDTRKDSCELIDIPDAMARAFRDYKGTVHLVSSHYVTRESLGSTLESAKHNCEVAYNSRHDGNPANYDDATWLGPFYNIDGKRVVALGHMEYHGWEHPGMCKSKIDTGTGECWYNADTFHISEDGGYHFTSPKAPGNYLASLPYKYQVDQGPEGYSVDSNIVKVGSWYYALLFGWYWPPPCNGGPTCLVPHGSCPIRTANILDPASWRGWDGKDFTVAFVDPYRGSVPRPQDHLCKPIPYMEYANGIYFHEASHMFIASLWFGGQNEFGPAGLYFRTSPDLIHWSKPVLAMTMNKMIQQEPEGNWSYAYFSLIDPKSTDPNYSTITDNPYLYYVRSDDNHGPYQRVLFRQRIKLDWMTTPGRNSSAP